MFKIPNWRAFQGYQRRGPPWVKLHANLLRHKFWPRLSILARATLPGLWIVASEQSQDGTIESDIVSLAHLLSMTEADLTTALIQLKSFGFIDSDEVVASSATGTSHQTERETELEAEKRDVYAPARAYDIDDELASEELRLMKNLVAIRDSGEDVQGECDLLERPKGQAPFNGFRALVGGKSGIPWTPEGLTVRKRISDAMEHRQRKRANPYVSEKNLASFDTIDRVLGTGAYSGNPALAEGKV